MPRPCRAPRRRGHPERHRRKIPSARRVFFAARRSCRGLAVWNRATSRLTRSIVTVALRRLGTIRAVLAELLEKGLPRQAAHLEWMLIAAAAQILFLEVPDHAAVDLAVRATRLEAKTAPYASLINGVLRNLAAPAKRYWLESDPLDHDTPAWLAARWRKTYGEAGSRARSPAPIARSRHSISRLNPILCSGRSGSGRRIADRLAAALDANADRRTPWLSRKANGGCRTPRRHCRRGCLRVGPGTRAADFCAAPGGKAAQLAAAGAEVTAIDRSAERLKSARRQFLNGSTCMPTSSLPISLA